MNAICFDMDGTIADLYSVENWLEKLRSSDPSPYLDAEPLVDMKRLSEICTLLQKAGYEIQIITCLSKDASPEYKKAIREAKKAWLQKYGFIYDHFHGIDYKANKNETLRRSMKNGGEAILIDDEARHADRWTWGPAINPETTDILEALYEMIPEELLK